MHSDSEPASEAHSSSHHDELKGRWWWLSALQSIGVVFGDLAADPLYVFPTVFLGQTTPPSESTVIGICSLIIWSLFLITSIKYCGVMMLADDKGEGGTFSLSSLLLNSPRSTLRSPAIKSMVNVMAIVCAALMLEDGVFTPAISVLSAMSGLATYFPDALGNEPSGRNNVWVLLITTGVLLLLFMIQRFGSGYVGAAFGPLVLLWQLTMIGVGLYHVILHPAVFAALNPWRAIVVLAEASEQLTALRILSGVFMALTGAEATYADIGHFGKGPIRLSWFATTFPSLVLCYLGQTAWLMRHPTDFASPFYSSIVQLPIFWPVFAVSLLATVVAAQGIIAATFSSVMQAVQLGLCPPVEVRHTSEKMSGQIYVPLINWILAALVFACVWGFGNSGGIAGAYGIAVAVLMLLTTILAIWTFHFVFAWQWWKTVPFAVVFLIIEIAYTSASISRFPEGGWLSVTIAVVVCSIMVTWFYGERLADEKTRHASLAPKSLTVAQVIGAEESQSHVRFEDRISIDLLRAPLPSTASNHENPEDNHVELTLGHEPEASAFSEEEIHDRIRECPRSPGIGVFVGATDAVVSLAVMTVARQLRTLPRIIFIFVQEPVTQSHVQDQHRIRREAVGIGYDTWVFRVRVGYMETSVSALDVLRTALLSTALNLPPGETFTFFTCRSTVRVDSNGWLPSRLWKSLYVLIKRAFPVLPIKMDIPYEETIEVGTRVLL